MNQNRLQERGRSKAIALRVSSSDVRNAALLKAGLAATAILASLQIGWIAHFALAALR